MGNEELGRLWRLRRQKRTTADGSCQWSVASDGKDDDEHDDEDEE